MSLFFDITITVVTKPIFKRRNLHRILLLDCCNNKQIFEVNWSLNLHTCIVVFYKSVQIDRFCPADVILRSWSTIWRRSGTPHVGSAKPNKIRRNWKLAQVTKCLFINLFWALVKFSGTIQTFGGNLVTFEFFIWQ